MDTTTTTQTTTTDRSLESLEKISRLFSALTLIEGLAAVKDPLVLSILSDIREAAGKALAVREVVEGDVVDLTAIERELRAEAAGRGG